MSKEFYQKLAVIQRTLNAPKNQYNSFGKYKYRSCEDILEGVKPLLGDLFLSIQDEIVQVGDRFYVKATASITDGESTHSTSAMARESLTKKGMDDAQVTGATSSYARKYCLNGLFGIDDSKDADSDAYQHQQNNAPKPKQQPQQQKPVNPDEVLNRATAAMSNADMLTLQKVFMDAQKLLKGKTEHLTKLTDVKNIRKAELEVGDL